MDIERESIKGNAKVSTGEHIQIILKFFDFEKSLLYFQGAAA